MLSRAACRFPRGRVQSYACINSSSQRGNVYCAQDSHLHHVVDRILASVAQRPLRRLDNTGDHFAPALDADRPFQEQVRACGRKRPAASTIDHPASSGETACLYQDGPHTPGPAGKHSADLETGPHHSFSQRRFCGGIVRASNSFGSTSRGQLLSSQEYPRRPSP